MDILIRRAKTLGLVLSFALIPSALSAQISPGELSQSHADLEGMRNCLKCHDLGEGPSDEKCLDCHKEIASGINQGRGYHSRMAGDDKNPCFDCHREHAGRDFELIHWPDGMDDFEHGKTGFRLLGKHAALRCRDCHNVDLIREDLSRFGDHIHLSRTFLGLGTDCLDCHHDEHRGQLARDCSVCHSNDAWKPASGFDHAKTAYPLTGRHVELPCSKCHEKVYEKNPDYPGSESFVRFAGLPRSNCSPCHEDIHRGKYGATCATCHNTSNWQDIPTAVFDHTKTQFPLLGLHRGLACEKCHAAGTKKAPLAHERCLDCHDDVHRGQFAARAQGEACEQCHTVDGFLPAFFSVEDHSDTRFALTGAHLAQPCIACHPTATTSDGASYRLFAVDRNSCESCHTDPHFGQFTASHPPKDCESCHSVGAWTPVEFSHDRDSNYKLEGEHRRVRCRSCHITVTEGGVTFVRYKPIDTSCQSCHGEQNFELSRTGLEPITGEM
jgi:hypothetical protein